MTAANKPRGFTIDTASVVAALLSAALLPRALSHPLLLWDSWMYHLPFSAYLLGIGGGVASFRLGDVEWQRWLGFPKAWEWVEGFAWWATGSLRFVAWPQTLLAVGYFLAMARLLQIRASWLVLAFFACPMLPIHFVAAYTDLPAGLAIAAGFLIFAQATEDARPSPTWLLIAACGFALAGNIKYQGVLGIGAASAVILILLAKRGAPNRARGLVLAALLLGAAAGLASTAVNLVERGNPFYPIEIRAMGRTVFAGPESPDMDAGYPVYVSRSGAETHLPEPVNFLLSLSELDWTLRGVAPWYNIDQVAGKSPRLGAPSRTGGWGGAFMLANLALLLAQIFPRRLGIDDAQRRLAIAALLLVAFTALLPRAHELRYWLYLPLVMAGVNVRCLARASMRGVASQGLALFALQGAALCVLSPNSELLEFRPISQDSIAAAVPSAVRDALGRDGRYCDPDDETLFIYSRAATGLSGLVSGRAEDCR